MKKARGWVLFFLAATLAFASSAQEPVVFGSLGGQQIRGYFFKSARGAPGAIVVTPGCAGLVDGKGNLAPFYAALAARWSSGPNVLLVDHFSSRGSHQDCGAGGGKMTSERDRANDVLGAYRYLAAREGIDARFISYLAYGGGAPILVLQQAALGALGGLPGFAAVAAFYPVCDEIAPGAYNAYSPLLILHGEADNWNPIRACRTLAERRSDMPAAGGVQLVAYPGAHHAFSHPGLPTMTWPGTHFTIGGDPAASADAHQRAAEFIRAAVQARAQSTLPPR